MKKTENVARVHTHTSNLLVNKQAKKLVLLNIFKTGFKQDNA